jgi:ketosteroid isomerase-like protein
MEQNTTTQVTAAQSGATEVGGASTAADLPALINAYLQAARDRDMAGCMAFFADDAKLVFMSGEFEGKPAIEQWHKERFDADLQFVRIDAVKAKGDVVTVDGVVTSKRLKAWKIGSIGGRATFRLQEGKIKETTFGMRLHNPLEGW